MKLLTSKKEIFLKKMYTNIPDLETEVAEFNQKELDSEKRIKFLEDKVRTLSEQVHRMASALELNSRQLRRQNTDINNVTTVLRSTK
jgi:septal ring factor EnvC (AmiA/AmiB activator)